MTRLPFILEDLAQAIRAVAPHGPDLVLELPAGTFGPVRDAIGDHRGVPIDQAATQLVVGGVLVKRKD